MLVDPYYRTMKGFAILIEKEWIYTGHHFPEVGLKSGKINVSSSSPFSLFFSRWSGYFDFLSKQDTNYYAVSWLQFLDAVWQLTRAFPKTFEFNEDFLIFLVHLFLLFTPFLLFTLFLSFLLFYFSGWVCYVWSLWNIFALLWEVEKECARCDIHTDCVEPPTGWGK